MTNEEIINNSMTAYNNLDIEGFIDCFSETINMVNFADNTKICSGIEEVRNMYQNLFENSPFLHSTIVSRIVFDNKVIDHESIVGRLGAADTVELVLIYELHAEKISKITVIRK
jgi:hypothetical protein